MRGIYILLLLILGFSTVPLSAWASYKVTPRLIDREVKQRDIFTEIITITNSNQHRISVYPSVNEVSVDAGGDITSFTPPSVSDNTETVTSWLSISRAKLDLDPGETKEIPLSVRIHPDAKPGVYHAVVGFGSGTNRPIAENQVKAGTAPSVIITLSVDQEKYEFLKLSRFVVDRFVTKPDNTAITYTLTNPGDADVVPKGEVIIYNQRGDEVGSIPVNPDQATLAPGQESTYAVAAPINGLLGKYKAFLTVDYGTEQVASVYDTAFFFVIPWQKLLILFIVVLVLALALTLYLHRRFAGDEYDYEHDELPLHIREGISGEKEHDINLKQK